MIKRIYTNDDKGLKYTRRKEQKDWISSYRKQKEYCKMEWRDSLGKEKKIFDPKPFVIKKKI